MTLVYDALRDAREVAADVWTMLIDALLVLGLMLEAAREIAERTIQKAFP